MDLGRFDAVMDSEDSEVFAKQMEANDRRLHASKSYKRFAEAIRNCQENRGCYAAWKAMKSLKSKLDSGVLTLDDKGVILNIINTWTETRNACPHCSRANDRHTRGSAYRKFIRRRKHILRAYGQDPSTPVIIQVEEA